MLSGIWTFQPWTRGVNCGGAPFLGDHLEKVAGILVCVRFSYLSYKNSPTSSCSILLPNLLTGLYIPLPTIAPVFGNRYSRFLEST